VKLIFIPFSVAGGLLAGVLGRKLFERVWSFADDQEPPDAEHRDVNFGKLMAALALEGAIFRLVKGAFDHGTRQGFERLTGEWPGEIAPEPK
jgi:hypothetical protein